VDRYTLYIVRLVEYLKKGFEQNSLDAPTKEHLVKQTHLLNKQLQSHLPTSKDGWLTLLPVGKHFEGAQWVYNRWNGKQLGAFGLLVWLRHLCCHHGGSIAEGHFEDVDEIDMYVLRPEQSRS
jgi:hypothetical protein